MPDAITRARSLIQARLAELDAEAKTLESALISMGEGSVRRPGRPRKRATTQGNPKATGSRKRKSANRAPRGQRRDELLAAIKADPGARPAELARAIGISANQVHSLIAKARKDKLLTKKGKGFAVKG